MTTPVWQSGKLYIPGDLVRPISIAPASPGSIPNPGFESGATGWITTGGASIVNEAGYTGAWSAKVITSSGRVESSTFFAVVPGQSVTASCYGRMPAGSDGTSFDCAIVWYDAANAPIGSKEGEELRRVNGSGWRKSTTTGSAPAGAAFFRVAADGNVATGGTIYLDAFALESYTAPASTAGLIYKAVQAAAGFSGSSEPAWPTTLGLTVVDNEVTWEAVSTSRVVWQASPILKAGTVEPTWPTTPGAFVSDGTVSWECVSRRVEDEKCPNTKVVAILSSKVFAADGDIVRFSATANPVDWSSPEDAGYLPTGLQQANANDMAVLAPYRSNLAAFNASGFQNWQVDPDPRAMAQLDQMEGIGSTWPRAAQPVGNELFYLSALGVRTVGIAAGAANLSAGDVGMPIDPLVQDAARVAIANGSKALATYYPSAGQYWLTFANYPPPAVAITGDLPDDNVNAAISYQYTVSGGVLPRAVSLLSGALPTGASINSAGLVTGTRTAGGVFSWTLRVTDADGKTADLVDTSTTITDPLYAQVISLMHFEGSGSTFTDQKGLSWTVGASNPAPIQTVAQKKFGNSSVRFGLTSGADSSFMRAAMNSAFFGGDFTVEHFVMFDATTGTQTTWTPANAAGDAAIAVQTVGAQWRVQITTSAVTVIPLAGTVSTGVWHHVALVRAGTALSLYVDGILLGTGTYSFTDPATSYQAQYGASNAGNSDKFVGYMDEARITKAARYTGNFTPPTRAFPDA